MGREKGLSSRRKKSPVPRLPASPARPVKAPADGAFVVIYLKEPREQSWGVLLKSEMAGVWVRSIPLDSLEDWAREVASGVERVLGPSTFFVPYLRVEKIVLDEPWGPVPSLAERFEKIAGHAAASFLQT